VTLVATLQRAAGRGPFLPRVVSRALVTALVALLLAGCQARGRKGDSPPRAGAAATSSKARPSAIATPRRNRPKATKPSPATKPSVATGCGGLKCRFIHRLMRPDQAPPLNQPRAVPGSRAQGLAADDRVLGVWLPCAREEVPKARRARSGSDQCYQARAYPLNLLAYHRVVNDTLGLQRLVVAHSPLSGTTLCAATDERMYATGAVYEGDDLLADERLGDLWSVALGKSILGPRKGTRLARLPCLVMTWQAWRRLRPRTDVAWPRTTPRGFDYTRDPWAWYRADDRHLVAPLHYVDLRLPYKRDVVGVSSGGARRVFAVDADGVVNTVVGRLPVVAVRHRGSAFAAAFRREIDGKILTFEARDRGPLLQLLDRETGSTWNLLGQAVAGPLAGERLTPVGTRAFFFAWAAFHPRSTIHSGRDNHG